LTFLTAGTLAFRVERDIMLRSDAVKKEGPMAADPPKDKRGPPRKPRPEEFMPAGKPGDDPITRNLKKVYEDIAAEPIPDSWRALLDELDSGKKKGEGDDS
jgi:Anti-sigma factor NepR